MPMGPNLRANDGSEVLPGSLGFLPLVGNGIKLRTGPVLRLRRERGYAQHERTFFNVFTPTPFVLSVAERSRRAQSARAHYLNTIRLSPRRVSQEAFHLLKRSYLRASPALSRARQQAAA